MPHSKKMLRGKRLILSSSNKGVDYESLDGQPTDLFFMIAARRLLNDTHLAALARIVTIFDERRRLQLRQVTSADQVIELDQASEKAQEPVWAPANESVTLS